MMKTTIIFLLVFFISCKSKENDIDLEFKVLETNTKKYPRAMLNNTALENAINADYYKVVTVNIINKNNDTYLYNSSRYHFPIFRWRENNRRFESSATIHNGDTREGCKILIKKNDSVTIYMTHIREADTLFLNLLWQRDSLGISDIKFYKDSLGEMKYYSSNRIKRNYKELEQSYQLYYSKCGILPRLKENE